MIRLSAQKEGWKLAKITVKEMFPEETQEERIFQLECHVSMLSDMIVQLIKELKEEGIVVSDKLKA
jgi:hypothetical protein